MFFCQVQSWNKAIPTEHYPTTQNGTLPDLHNVPLKLDIVRLLGYNRGIVEIRMHTSYPSSTTSTKPPPDTPCHLVERKEKP